MLRADLGGGTLLLGLAGPPTRRGRTRPPTWSCRESASARRPPLYSVLMGYKESPVGDVRRRGAAVIDALFTAFFGQHGRCVADMLNGPPGLVLPVPSTSRPPPAPLDRINGLGAHVLRALAGTSGGDSPLWGPDVLGRTGQPIGHMAPHPGAFEVPTWAAPLVSRHRVLLLDDTYVSGARAQSAAAALRRAGASRVLIVPLGRVIRPDRLPEHAALLARSRADRTDRTDDAPSCARCVVRQRDTGAGADE